MSRPAYLFAPQAYLPGPPISNADMEAHLGQFGDRPSRSRALVLKRNGIKNRHYARAADGSWHSDLAGMSANAAQQALKLAGHVPQDVGLIAGSCTLSDHLVPGCASQVHARLARDADGWQGTELASYQSVCAASAMAIKGAAAQVRLGEHDLALVTGGEFASRYLHAGQYSHLRDQMEALPFEADFLRFTLSDGGGAALIGARPPKGIPAFKIHWIDIRSYADRFPVCMSGGAARRSSGGWTAFANAGEAAAAGAFTLQQDFSLLDSLVAAWVHHYLDLINSGKLARSDFDWVRQSLFRQVSADAGAEAARRCGSWGARGPLVFQP